MNDLFQSSYRIFFFLNKLSWRELEVKFEIQSKFKGKNTSYISLWWSKKGITLCVHKGRRSDNNQSVMQSQHANAIWLRKKKKKRALEGGSLNGVNHFWATPFWHLNVWCTQQDTGTGYYFATLSIRVLLASRIFISTSVWMPKRTLRS